jgi:hypothetical protein
MEGENVHAMSSTWVETRPIFCIHLGPVHADPCFPNLRPFLREPPHRFPLSTLQPLAVLWKTDLGSAAYTKHVLFPKRSWAKLETTAAVFTCSRQ